MLARAKAGEDFAKLANQYTEEEVGKTRGGDLDFFGRGQMAKEFEEAAFALKPGQISDIVKTQFGLHIIKTTDHKPAATRPLEEVKAQIEDQLKWERAQNEAQRLAEDLDKQIDDPGDFDTVGKARGLTVGESEFFAKDEPIAGLGMAPAVAERAFEMKQGETSKAIRTPQGFAFISLTGTQPERMPALDEVKARVRDDVVKSKAADTARQRAAALSAQLKSGNFEAAAKAAGLEVKTTEQIARGAPIADVGISPAVEAVAFTAAGRRRQRSDQDRQRRGRGQGRSSARTSRPTSSPKGRGRAARSAHQRAPQPLLLDLHGQGAREDAHQPQRGDDRAGALGSCHVRRARDGATCLRATCNVPSATLPVRTVGRC